MCSSTSWILVSTIHSCVRSTSRSISQIVTKNGCLFSPRMQRTMLLDSFRISRNFSSHQTTNLTDVIDTWTQRLSDEGIPEPQSSVDLIVAHVMGKKMIHEVDTNTVPSDNILKIIDGMCQLRLKRTPVQYIIKEWDFIDMTLEMCPPILIPRPETEELAMMVVDDLRMKVVDQGGIFLEIGFGSGALSLHILKTLPKMKCVAVDINKTACDLTMRNATKYSLQDRISVIHGDAFQDGIMRQLSQEGRFDVIVSNPPYIRSHEMMQLEPEVSKFEDHTALHGGNDGLDVVRNILQFSKNLLKPEGCVWLEVGLNQTCHIETIVKHNSHLNLTYDQTLQDFSKRDRFCTLTYRPPIS